MRVLAAAIALVLVGAACGSEPFRIDATDAEIEAIAASWNAEMELNRGEASVWRPRLNAACTDGIWLIEVSDRLANQFMAADLITANEARYIDQSDLDRAAIVIWRMTAEVCPERFPTGELDRGPPSE